MYNSLSEKLEIFIITFNRASKLDATLSRILADDSPVKNFRINVIDNNSTDKTFEVVSRYLSLHNNLYYEKNKYNIGGNANIVSAFYKAEREYVWILADNDDYCWDNWNEVEQYINDKSDAVVVATYECPKYDIAQLYNQMTFLPGVIYKTSNIDDTVIGNMEFNIANLFPHLALALKLINENKKISIVDKAIVLAGDNRDENGDYIYTRGYDSSYVHPLQKGMNWLCGYANSLWLIQDEKIRNYIISHNRFCSELNSPKLFFWNPKDSERNVYNYLCIFAVLSLWDKIIFILNVILYYSLYRIIFISKREAFDLKRGLLVIQYNLRLFYYIKTKLYRINKNIEGVC